MKPILTILGPTATGKSAVALELARQLNGEIVSCDAMQIYRGMDIGTAKPTRSEQAAVKHWMIDITDPQENYSAAQYAVQALYCIQDIQNRGKTAIVCGGTGFYWRTLYRGGSKAPPGDPLLRAELSKNSVEELHQKLIKIDPVAAERIAPNDTKRVIRALEVYELTKKPLSSFQAHGEPRFPAVIFGLHCDRETLYQNINNRVDVMLQNGLLTEIKTLLQQKIPTQSTAMQAIGYKEFIGVIAGETPLEAAVEQCKQNTRRYAKRQLTWLKKEELQWIETDQTSAAQEILRRYSQTAKSMI